jgi:hypothetical protein
VERECRHSRTYLSNFARRTLKLDRFKAMESKVSNNETAQLTKIVFPKRYYDIYSGSQSYPDFSDFVTSFCKLDRLTTADIIVCNNETLQLINLLFNVLKTICRRTWHRLKNISNF